ncbi:MAG: dihydropteroate synthase [Candidatus Thorarchaeota archaeon]|nr:MAG: dihydropteroate synthase [Candidatus Thorarchaeota archaeon]
MGLCETDIDGLKVGRENPTRVMGVINLSPESFYGGSVATSRDEIVRQVQEIEREGADIIDVGAASSAPKSIYGTTRVGADQELTRVSEAFKSIVDNTHLPVSIDTTSATVAHAALDLGAALVNDVSGLRTDNKMGKLVADADVPIILMADCGEPCLGLDATLDTLKTSMKKAIEEGIGYERIVVDPGIGFGKPTDVDLSIIRNLRRFTLLERPLLVGVSRKAFIGQLLGQPDPAARIVGTIAATSLAVANGADMIRAHDVEEARMAAIIGRALRHSSLMTRDNIELMDLSNEREAALVIEQLGADAEIVHPLAEKAVMLSFRIREAPTSAALIIKQEMLAVGGDAAYHHDVIDHRTDHTDILIMGTPLQLGRMTKRISKMQYFRLIDIAKGIQSLMADRSRQVG